MSHTNSVTAHSTSCPLANVIDNMANDDSSQSPKDYKKNILFSVVEPIGKLFNNSQPVPSKGSQGHSSKSPGRKILSKIMTTSPSQSTSLPMTFSTENPGGETSLGKYRIFSLYILNCHPSDDGLIAIPRLSHTASIVWTTRIGYFADYPYTRQSSSRTHQQLCLEGGQITVSKDECRIVYKGES